MAQLTQQEASAALAAKVEEVYKVVLEAEALADEYKLEFNLSIDYGIGGTYTGDPDSWLELGWNPSSQSC